jgi:glyoxylase-like metal-dependent hydrolase (beta-lactamase superfamily II)
MLSGETPMSKQSLVLAVAASCGLTACSSAPTPKRVADDALAAMGGADKVKAVHTITMKGGSGTRLRLGQSRHAGDPEEPAPALKNVVEIADLANGRASLDYELTNGAFTQHRHEILTKKDGKPVGVEIIPMRPIIATSPSGLFSWGTQNSPEFLLRRNAVTIALVAAESAPDGQAAEDKTFDGKMAKAVAVKTKAGEDVTVYFDPQTKLPLGYDVLDTETMLGDVPAQYLLTDYRAVDGVTLPHHIKIRKGGKDYSEVQFASIAINDPAAQQEFDIPADVTAEVEQVIASGDFSRVALTKVADGVYFASGYSHHSMVVEFPSWLAVVEAPYTGAQTETLVRMLSAQFPGKPVKYAAVTHHHYDHTGGVRRIAAHGATVLVEKGHEGELRPILEARHTHPQDELERRRSSQPAQQTGSIEVYEGKKVIADGKQSLELYPFLGSPHVEPMVMAYVPSAKALFQSDLWFPGIGGTGNPGAKQLLDSIRMLKLKVDTMVGGHGGVGPFAELEKAIAAMPAAN